MRIMLCHCFRPFRNALIPQGFSYIYNAVSPTIFPVLWQQRIQYLESSQVLPRPGSRLCVALWHLEGAGWVCMCEGAHASGCARARVSQAGRNSWHRKGTSGWRKGTNKTVFVSSLNLLARGT